MSTTNDPRERLVHDALDSYKNEHRELFETWRSLDSKAQGAITVSGIFLAGILGFIRTLTEATGPTEKWLLTATALLLTLSIIFSLWVLWVRTVERSPLGDALDTLVKDLLETDDDIRPEQLVNYCRDHAGMWSETNRDVDNKNSQKAGRLIMAQVMLALAIVCAATVTLMEVWN